MKSDPKECLYCQNNETLHNLMIEIAQLSVSRVFLFKEQTYRGRCLVAYDALNRNESCGGHFREEYQTEEGEAKRDDENFFYVACWEYQGDDEKAPVLIKEPLVYEAIKVQTRNYKS